ncbi:hypothetical protein M5K25_018101 [Dendrobium thyrsiflorum]|uniref:Endonuclease/exonuclease/phosphatase domain-containing protein n=1 Tax=Dendrobium thyrsiflorum TaxID=117978 RepID=A0ABD0UPL0_DENTH
MTSSLKLDMFCILENRIHAESLQSPFFLHNHVIFPSEQSCHNFELSTLGRIWVKWNATNLNFVISLKTDQMITGFVSSNNTQTFLLSIIYASNDREARSRLWDQLRSCVPTQNIPWIVMGDFNCYRFASEKLGGNALTQSSLGEFNSMIFDANMSDLPSIGNTYTWFNQRQENPIHIKLDRILVNEYWMNNLSNTYYSIQAPSCSDHCPLILQNSDVSNANHRFMFKNYWTSLDSFWYIVLDVFSVRSLGNPITDFCSKLKSLKCRIKGEPWANSNDILDQLNVLHAKQSDYLGLLSAEPNSHSLNTAFKHISQHISALSTIQSSWIIQRAKASWLSQGEDNLKFLYAKIKRRMAYGNSALNRSSSFNPSKDDAVKEIIQHFQNLFNPVPPSSSNMDDDLLVFGVPSIPNCYSLMDILNTFSVASRLYINSDKSTLLISKSIPHTDDICRALNLHNFKDVITYLGIPIAYKRLKINDFHPLMENITKKLSGWNASLLSLTGRLQFLKYTMTNSIAYWIRGSILPKYVHKFFNKIASKILFFGDALTGRKLHMVAWENVCKPKCKGGLGLHSIPALIYGFNCSLILRFSNVDYPLAAWISAKYGNPWQAPPPPSCISFLEGYLQYCRRGKS